MSFKTNVKQFVKDTTGTIDATATVVGHFIENTPPVKALRATQTGLAHVVFSATLKSKFLAKVLSVVGVGATHAAAYGKRNVVRKVVLGATGRYKMIHVFGTTTAAATAFTLYGVGVVSEVNRLAEEHALKEAVKAETTEDLSTEAA